MLTLPDPRVVLPSPPTGYTKEGWNQMAHVPESLSANPGYLDSLLSRLSPDAGYLWVRILLRMHISNDRGYLVWPSGRAYSMEDLRDLGSSMARSRLVRAIQEIEDKGAFVRSPSGVMYCPWMVREEEIRKIRQIAAGKRWTSAGKGI